MKDNKESSQDTLTVHSRLRHSITKLIKRHEQNNKTNSKGSHRALSSHHAHLLDIHHANLWLAKLICQTQKSQLDHHHSNSCKGSCKRPLYMHTQTLLSARNLSPSIFMQRQTKTNIHFHANLSCILLNSNQAHGTFTLQLSFS